MEKIKQNLPKITQELLDYLDLIIPDKHPGLNYPDRKIWFEAGKRDVVRILQLIFNHQNQNRK